ncbi:MAG: cytochrome c-type biogenesis protein CcmH [Methylobacter sp.]|uniref:cytochrome c-type biogenesis protein n=1 Tax=Methylobacter sp. TaxID=2051955 RepID=UPI0027302C91|nr:cytochrome c-type biogenesis protein [Methylobacter sp.]MDP1665739.1 cytochrome c-type biogenesis protein CcmH [Methylobacter sp.]MDP1969435.1 cytochrome c-type biogenesis protein CcmH [Methylobacter sp.]
MKYLSIILLLILSGIACAGVEYRQFANSDQQEAYETLTSELRCLVCQNQTIADSNAELAADLRRQVYEMLQQGKSKQDIAQFMTDRYGDFVLYNPPFKAKTGVLWIGPVVFLLIGLIVVFLFARRKKTASVLQANTGNENAEKLAKIRNLLEKGDQS